MSDKRSQVNPTTNVEATRVDIPDDYLSMMS